MDKKAQEELEDIVFVQLNVITAMTVARHLGITTMEAQNVLAQFHDLYKKDDGIRAVYSVSGQKVHCDIKCGAVVLAKQDKLEEVKSTFTEVESVDLFALHKDPIDNVADCLAYDLIEDEKFFRTDPDRASIKTVRLGKLREKMEAWNQEKGKGAKAAPAGGKHDVKPVVKTEVKKEIIGKSAEQKKIANMFQKACEKEKTPKNTPKKVRDSPFSSAEKQKTEESPVPKRRARKIRIDSEDELSPAKKVKSPVKEEPKEKEEGKPKNRDQKKKLPEPSLDDDIFEAESPEKSPPREKTPKKVEKKKAEKRKKPLKEEENEEVPLRRSPRKVASSAPPGKKKVFRKELDTFLDDDGFLVTKEVLKEVEIDEEEEVPKKPLSPKKTNQSAPAAKKKAPPTGQAKLTSFFSKPK